MPGAEGDLVRDAGGLMRVGQEAIAPAPNWLAWTYQASKHAQADHPHALVGHDL